jgi:uncharacterized membrane protein YkoI
MTRTDEIRMKDHGSMAMKKVAPLFHGPFIRRCNLQSIDGRPTAVPVCTHKEGHMKHSRIIALVASALLAVGATAFVAPKAFAQSSAPSAQLRNNTGEQADGQVERESAGVDGDSEHHHGGDQNGWDDREVGYRHDPMPQGKPAITAAAAITAAETYLKTADVVAQLKLEDENGGLVYSVWIGGTDVKVDAMTGKVLTADSSGY